MLNTNKLHKTLLSVCLVWLCACQPPAPTAETNNTLFELLPAERTGIDFANSLTETTELNILNYMYFYNGGGVAVGDINNDGLPDLYFSANQKPNKLYLNKGNWQFEDITQKAGVAANLGWTTGVSMADVNADGLLDIYVCQVGGLWASTTATNCSLTMAILLLANKQPNTGLTHRAMPHRVPLLILITTATLICFCSIIPFIVLPITNL